MPKRMITKGEYMELSSMNMGQRIRYLRERLRELHGNQGFTTVDVAESVQIKQQSLTAIELSETKNPKFMVIYRLSKAFNVPIEVFTDDFYEKHEIQLFSIGFDESGEGGPEVVQVKTSKDAKEDEEQFRLGLAVYQLFSDDTMRLVLTKETDYLVAANHFVELLTRLFCELKLLEIKTKDRMQYSSEYENLYNRALNVYHGIFKYPEAYPKRDVGWFRDFVEHYAGNAEERK